MVVGPAVLLVQPLDHHVDPAGQPREPDLQGALQPRERVTDLLLLGAGHHAILL